MARPNRREFLAAAAAAALARITEMEAEYEASLPTHPRLGEWLMANPLPGCEVQNGRLEGWEPEQHGSREEVEAAVAAWVAELEAVAAQAQREAEAAEALAAEQRARAEKEAAEAAAARADQVAALQADQALVAAALERGDEALTQGEVVRAVLRIAAAGAARLQA